MKRLVAVLLSAALAAGVMPAALAAAKDVPQREKEAVLRELEIMEGDETGALHLERNITRGEFTKLLVSASPYKGSVGDAATDPYPDVSHRDWFAPYVRAAVDAGLVKGDLEGYFRPQRAITLAEGVTMAVRLLGYQDRDFSAAWPAGQLALYRSLDLDEGVKAARQDELLTREDCLHLFYNLLTASTKQGQTYGNTLGCVLNAKGEVDVPTLFRVEQEGPVVVSGNWQEQVPFDVSAALIYRDNDRAVLDDLREWDLVYWAKDDAILFAASGSQSSMGQMAGAVEGPVVTEGTWWSSLPFALDEAAAIYRNGRAVDAGSLPQGQELVYWGKYDKKLYFYDKNVSGTVEAVAPSLAAPTAVTVAGQTYALETFEAQYAFSDLGEFRKGDRVKLLLGRGGGVAAVRPLSPEEDSGRVGIVAALESKTYLDDSDRPYAEKVITVTGADGASYSYPYAWNKADDFEPGELVRVSVLEGKTTVTRASGSLSGQVNAAATRIGSYVLSADAEIMDTYGDATFCTVPASRLAGMTLTGDMVRYAQIEDDGTVTTLILNDVTGDLHRYGVMTGVEVISYPGSLQFQSVYTYDIGGRSQTLPLSGKRYSVEKGPFVLKTDGGEVKTMKNLTKATEVTLSGAYALQSGRRLPLADGVVYYTRSRSDGAYTLSSRDQVLASGGPLTAWYDSSLTSGGRVRVVVAEVA